MQLPRNLAAASRRSGDGSWCFAQHPSTIAPTSYIRLGDVSLWGTQVDSWQHSTGEIVKTVKLGSTFALRDSKGECTRCFERHESNSSNLEMRSNIAQASKLIASKIFQKMLSTVSRSWRRIESFRLLADIPTWNCAWGDVSGAIFAQLKYWHRRRL